MSDACCSEPRGPADYAASIDWPADISRDLYTWLTELPLAGQTVLDIGCGHGRLLVGALLAGAERATGIDLDPEAIAAARDRVGDAHLGDRVTLLVGDGLDERLEPHDLVMLDRVICCDPDGEELARRGLASARWAFAMSVPESRGIRGAWNRVVYGLDLVRSWLRREGRVYLHDVPRLERAIRDAGFVHHRSRRTGKWYLAVYLRPGDGSRTR